MCLAKDLGMQSKKLEKRKKEKVIVTGIKKFNQILKSFDDSEGKQDCSNGINK